METLKNFIRDNKVMLIIILLLFLFRILSSTLVYASEHPIDPIITTEPAAFSLPHTITWDSIQYHTVMYRIQEIWFNTINIRAFLYWWLVPHMESMSQHTLTMYQHAEKMYYMQETIVEELSHQTLHQKIFLRIQDSFRLVHTWHVALTSAVIGLMIINILAELWTKAA